MNELIQPDKEAFIALTTIKMPFGKYKGSRLVDLPERYLVWLSQKGFPEGKLGEMLQAVYEIKLNGLDPSLRFSPKKRLKIGNLKN
jgi:uncharacterized protein (DUF3820 family)